MILPQWSLSRINLLLRVLQALFPCSGRHKNTRLLGFCGSVPVWSKRGCDDCFYFIVYTQRIRHWMHVKAERWLIGAGTEVETGTEVHNTAVLAPHYPGHPSIWDSNRQRLVEPVQPRRQYQKQQSRQQLGGLFHGPQTPQSHWHELDFHPHFVSGDWQISLTSLLVHSAPFHSSTRCALPGLRARKNKSDVGKSERDKTICDVNHVVSLSRYVSDRNTRPHVLPFCMFSKLSRGLSCLVLTSVSLAVSIYTNLMFLWHTMLVSLVSRTESNQTLPQSTLMHGHKDWGPDCQTVLTWTRAHKANRGEFRGVAKGKHVQKSNTTSQTPIQYITFHQYTCFTKYLYILGYRLISTFIPNIFCTFKFELFDQKNPEIQTSQNPSWYIIPNPNWTKRAWKIQNWSSSWLWNRCTHTFG